jgi:hypothetical protein
MDSLQYRSIASSSQPILFEPTTILRTESINVKCERTVTTEPLRFLISNHEGHEEYEEKQGIVFIILRELRVLRG